MRGPLTLAAVLIGTLLLAPLLSAPLRGVRIDLTQGHLYTLSDATRKLLADLPGDVTLTLYFSDKVSSGLPDLRAYAQHVQDTLHEYVAQAHGYLKLRVLDPAPFSEAEDAAAAAGLQAVPLGMGGGATGDAIYFGLVGASGAAKNANVRTDVIGFLQPDREQFLEYELDKLIHGLTRKKAPVVGLMSSLPVEPRFDFTAAQPSGGWVSVAQLRQAFDLRAVQLTDAAALRALDVLVLIHPQHLLPNEQFNLDQYVLRGGRLLAFIDPNADSQAQQPRSDGASPPVTAALQASNLGPLLTSWGVDYDETRFVADPHYALTVGMGDNAAPARHFGILGIDSEGMDRADIIAAQLKTLNVSSAGALSPRKGATTHFAALVHSSTDAALLSTERVRTLTDPNSLAQGFQPGGRPLTIAARITGRARTAFPQGAPAAAVAASTPVATTPVATRPVATTSEATTTSIKVATVTTGDINVLIFADTDFLSDALWVQIEPVFGQQVARPFANNGDFLINAVDQLAGSTALVSVRGRAAFQRPFLRVAELMRRADERSVQQAHGLQTQLQETENRLVALQRLRGDGNDSHAALQSAAQKQELAKFAERKLSIRKALRQVQRDLTVDIEQLGTLLKMLNTLAVPALLTLLALAWGLRRRWRASAGSSAQDFQR